MSIGRLPRRRFWPASPSVAPTPSATPTAVRSSRSRSTSSDPARPPSSTTLELPAAATEALVHVRDYTKGHPTIARQQPPDPARIGGRHPQRDHRQRRGDLRALRLRPRRARDDRRLGGDLRAHGRARGCEHAALEELQGAMAAAWIDERAPTPLHLARGVARPLWIGRAPPRAVLRLDEGRARGRRGRAAADAPQAGGLRGAPARRSSGGRIASETRFRPDRCYRDDNALPPVRAPHERRLVPREARNAHRVERPSSEPSVGPHGDALLAQALADEELECRPRADVDVDEPVDLPLGEQRRVVARGPPSSRPSCGRRPSSRASTAPWATARSSFSSPIGHVEAGLPQRRAERAERVPDQRLRRHPSAVRVEIACRRRAAELLPEAAAAARAAPRG